MKEDWKIVADVTVCDEFHGLAEIMNYSDGIFFLQWVSLTPCYKCQVYSADVYKTITAYPKEDIYEISNVRLMESKDIISKRRESIKQDKEVFRRYKKLVSA